MWWVWWMTAALGGGVFINDVQVDPSSLAGRRLTQVAVQFDEDGNLRIEAPGYEVRLTEPNAPRAAPPAVDVGQYWLVTEDNGSGGHVVEVEINGQAVATIASGEAQRVIDIGRWLRRGDNSVTVRATSHEAAGGSLYLYVGTGQTSSEGTMVMDDPAVEFGLDASREGVVDRVFSFLVE